MSNWRPKRFWKAASVVADEGGFAVHLDGRPVKTPAKQPLLLPTHALATLVAAEWDAQSGLVNPETMPITRMANSAIDKVVDKLSRQISKLKTKHKELKKHRTQQEREAEKRGYKRR